MREILFHGKRIDNGEWVEGIPIKTHIGTFIVFEENPHYCNQYGYMEICELATADPATVGQYTGLTDKNGKKIFEGDIVEFYFYDWDYRDGERVNVKCTETVCIEFGESTFDMVELFRDFRLGDKLEIITEKIYQYRGTRRRGIYKSNNIYSIEIIGNIHDNPELLKGAENNG